MLVCGHLLLAQDFPYNEPFSSTTAPSGVIKPTLTNGSGATITNSAEFTVNGVELTPAVTSRIGLIYLNNIAFTSQDGLRV